MTDIAPILSLSIVSHGQGALITALLADIKLQLWNNDISFEVILTLNITEDEGWLEQSFPFPLIILRNHVPKGFGANHNSAYAVSRGKYFAVINPDIRLIGFRIAPLIESLSNDETGVCGPLVYGPEGTLQDSARRFPSFGRLVLRKLLRRRSPDYVVSSEMQQVDWLAGMFLLFPADVYRAIGGFNERYFMYLEDVEICRFLQQRGFHVVWVTSVHVVHDAARASRRSRQHMKWHLTSMLRYFFARSRK